MLGEAVTPEIAAAWDEVYWLFACSLIAEEARLYALAGTDPAHPWRTYRVVEREDETDDVFSLANLRRQVLAMGDAKAQNWYESEADSAPTLHPARAGRMDLTDIDVPGEAQVFMGGPLPFMQQARQALLGKGIRSENIHYEVFGPDLWAQNIDSSN